MYAEVVGSQGGPNPLFTNEAAVPSPEAFHSTTFARHQSFLRRWLRTRLQRCLRSLCSLSVLVALLYLVFLASVAVIITTSTSIKTSQVLESTWEDTHRLQVANIESSIAGLAATMKRRTVAAASLYAQTLHPVESNRTLTMLCAQLAIGDTNFRIRGLALGAFSVLQYALCTHADETNPSPENMTAIMSDKGTFYGSFFINPATYTYYDPPVKKTGMNQNMTGAQQIEIFKHLIPTLGMLDAYMNGTRGPLLPVELWTATVNQTNKMYFTFPLYMLGDAVPYSPLVHPSDFAQTRIDADTLLNISDLTNNDVSIRAMVLGRSSLTTADPIVLSNNWKQPGVSQSVYLIIINSSTTYLTVSNITDPLMREAVKHIDLKKLLVRTYNYTTSFNYHGAPALVTAWVYVNDVGFSLPIVLVTPQHAIAGPTVTIWRICTGTVAVAVFLTTLLLYLSIDRYLSRPLREVTAAMEASVERGVRQPVRGAACDVVQLAETRELTCAYNAAMAQLRVVDAFVPDAVRATRRGGPSLREHYLTVVTVRVRAGNGAGGAGGGAYGGDVGVDTSALLRRHPGAGAGAGGVSGDRGRRGGGGLAALVNAVAEAATALTNSGPFASAASLSAFVAAVRELCEARGGTVHRAAPDECVLHFAANVRRVLSGSGAGSGGDAGAATSTSRSPPAAAVERAADADARAGVECALCVSRWVEQQQQQRGNSNNSNGNSGSVEAVPDVRVVVDSGVFVCGEYRAPGSEQTLCVALGRDVAGAVGHVPAAIGVRVAATGEVALRVRGGAGGYTGGAGTPGAAAAAAACSSPPSFPPTAAERGGFRVLPVEVLRTGRAGLDGGAVTLYEVLPGAVDGDAAWLAYARCCVDGFECMVRGDYAGALRAYRGVGEIGDLEPGLLPRCLSREAAHSDAVGGAVSVQVARLLRECERRVRAGSTAGYERGRHVPLGIDAVLGVAARYTTEGKVGAGKPHLRGSLQFSHTSDPGRSAMTLSTGCGSPRSGESGKGSAFIHRWGAGYGSECRYLVTVQTFSGPVRRCVGSLPPVIRDNKGLKWLLPRTKDHERAAVEWMRPYPVLGSAGTLCSVMTVLFREGAGMFRKKLDGVPDGPMSDELRSAIPVWTLSDGAVRGFDSLIAGYSRRVHPNIVQLVSYSLEVEGRAVIMWEYCPGGTMRDVVRRYSYLSRVTLLRFSTGLLSALVYTHACGAAHGYVSQDTVVVGTDGVCRLMGGYADYALGVKLMLVWNTCYVSPLMATGAAPTPACDMFLYGLMALEVLTRGPAWMWASVPDGSAPHGADAELAALMAAGAKAFCDAVVNGRVVPNVACLSLPAHRDFYGDEWCDSILRLLSYDPAKRPTAAQLLAETKEIILRMGK